jgi:hypothetical protein
MTLQVGDLAVYITSGRRSFNDFGIVTFVGDTHVDFDTLDDYATARARPECMRRAIVTFGGPVADQTGE